MSSENNKNKKMLSFATAMFKRGSGRADMGLKGNESLKTPIATIMTRLLKNKFAIIGAVAFLAIFSFCFIGALFVSLEESQTELTHANLPPGLNFLDFPSELNGADIREISFGISFSAAISESGQFYLWGSEPNKEQENVSTYIFDIPEEVKNAKITLITCGGNHILAIDENDNFYAWGYNGNGQTDLPQDIERVFSSTDVNVVKAEATSQWTALLGSDNNLYIWGSINAKNTLLIPSDLKGHIVDFAAGDNNIALLLDDGTVHVIGDKGSEFAMNLPAQLTDGQVKITKISATNRNVLALDEDGQLYSWGSTQDGLNNLPQIEDEIIDIAAGYRDFILLTAGGDVITWGNGNYNEEDLPYDLEQIYGDYFQFYGQDINGDVYSWGNEGYIFGTDQFGRDIFSRIIHGGKTSLTVGAIAVVISVVIALIVGLSSGYFGGVIDHVLMRITDVFSAIPFFPIAITLSYVVGYQLTQVQKMYMIMVILGLLGWMSLARLIRAQLLLEREKDFVIAARALGLKNHAIMCKHILPNILSLVIVNITLGYSSSLLAEAALSFLGFGVSEPTPSWGNMLMSAQEIAVIEFYWWRFMIPALFVIITVVSVNMIGDALREALDPKSGG